MSLADKKFKEMCNSILTSGTDTKGEAVRPIWPDTGEKAYTIKKFGVVNEYDLREEFPALTLRKTAIKSAMDEILWIFQRKSNNIKDLKPHIWDEWADENGSIVKAYGYQIGQTYIHHSIKNISSMSAEEFKNICESLRKNYPSLTIHFEPESQSSESYIATLKKQSEYKLDSIYYYPEKIYEYLIKNNINEIFINFDQMDAVLYELRNTPYSRRIMTGIYNFKDLHEMGLNPCCWSCTFNVTDEGCDKLVLNMILNQRSNDVLAANNWNVVQYSLLLMMVAQCVDMIPGKLLHVIADAHIYDRHVPMIQELLSREEFDAPIVKLNPEIKNFYDFTTDDITIENYQHGEQIKNIPIAV
jgi:thymidylate synthase